MSVKKTNSDLTASQYVSRAGEKLAAAAKAFKINFRGTTVLDVGSSTGGFSDFALQNGAKKIIAIEKGTKQFSPRLRQNSRIELHEKTDIFDFKLSTPVDIIMIDVSFVRLEKVLSYIKRHLALTDTIILAMLKPQFEAQPNQLVNGKIKNHKIRREIIKNFEQKISHDFKIVDKRDNHLPGREEGNIERFYYLTPLRSFKR